MAQIKIAKNFFIAVPPIVELSLIIPRFSIKIKAAALYIINFGEIVYHQNEVLYIIIAKEYTAYG